MINDSIRLLFVLAVLLLWPGVADSVGDCDGSLGGDTCQNQDLNANHDPPGGDECGGNIVVVSATTSGAALSVSLSNPTFATEQGFLVADVLLEGKRYTYVIPISVTGRSGLSLNVTFPGTITTIGVRVCSSRPGGINEGPDVVAVKQQDEEPTD